MTIWDRIRRFFRTLPQILQRTTIRAVHDDDLLPLLASLGIDAEILDGQRHCLSCGNLITMDNLWGILHRGGQIHIVCSDPDCISELY